MSLGAGSWENFWTKLPLACLAVDSMLLGMDKEVWEITDTSRNLIQTQGEWELLGINKATAKMLVGSNLYDQIMFYVSPGAPV